MNSKSVKALYRPARKTVLLSCLLWMLNTGRVPAQNINAGEIRGTVTDQTGAAVPGATVTIANTDTGVQTVVKTDATGVYDVPSLTPGIYTVSISSPSFKTAVQTNILLRIRPITVNATLETGLVGQKVVVSANYTQLQKCGFS